MIDKSIHGSESLGKLASQDTSIMMMIRIGMILVILLIVMMMMMTMMKRMMVTMMMLMPGSWQHGQSGQKDFIDSLF